MRSERRVLLPSKEARAAGCAPNIPKSSPTPPAAGKVDVADGRRNAMRSAGGKEVAATAASGLGMAPVVELTSEDASC